MLAAITARALTLMLGCLAVLWGATILPRAWLHSSVEDTAQRIISGEAFRLEGLDEMVPLLNSIEAEAGCRPADLHGDAVIRMRIAESTLIEGDPSQIDPSMAAARSAIQRSLTCSPSDPFLWFALYWVDVATRGFNAGALTFLRMSYELGPNEGWIIVRRNRAALAVFSRLPPDLAEQALSEFAKLLEPRLTEYAADILTGPGWPIRDVLLARIADTPQSQRQDLADILRSRGYAVAVPGIVQKERPWL